MREKNRKKLIQVILVVFLAILLFLGTAVILQPYPKQVREVSSTYSLSSNLYLNDVLKNNSLYGDNATLINPSTIYSSITKKLYVDANFLYNNPKENSTSVYFKYAVTLHSNSPTWSKGTYVSDGNFNLTNGHQENLYFGIDIASNISEGQAINSQLGVSSGASYSISLSLSTVSSFGYSNSTIDLSIGHVSDSLVGPSNKPFEGYTYSNATIPGYVIIPVVRTYGYLFLGVAAPFGIALAFVTDRKKQNPIEKFIKENSENLVSLKQGPPEDAVRVEKTDDIFKIASFTEKPVFVFNDRIFVELDGKVYYAEIRK